MKAATGILGAFLILSASLAVALVLPVESGAAADKCKFECTGVQVVDGPGKEVVEVLEKMMKALELEDYQGFAATLEDDASMVDESTKEMTVGKEAILVKIKSCLIQRPQNGAPLLHFQIQEPFARVKGDTGVVTFSAIKEYGGKHPYKMQSRCSDVFGLKDGKWLLIHHRAAWKKV